MPMLALWQGDAAQEGVFISPVNGNVDKAARLPKVGAKLPGRHPYGWHGM